MDLRQNDGARKDETVNRRKKTLLKRPRVQRAEDVDVRLRRKLVQAMQTVQSIQEIAENEAVRLLSTQLVQQFTDILPDLEHASPPALCDERESSDEDVSIVALQISEDYFRDLDGREPGRRVQPALQKIRDAARRRASVTTESCKA